MHLLHALPLSRQSEGGMLGPAPPDGTQTQEPKQIEPLATPAAGHPRSLVSKKSVFGKRRSAREHARAKRKHTHAPPDVRIRKTAMQTDKQTQAHLRDVHL